MRLCFLYSNLLLHCLRVFEDNGSFFVSALNFNIQWTVSKHLMLKELELVFVPSCRFFTKWQERVLGFCRTINHHFVWWTVTFTLLLLKCFSKRITWKGIFQYNLPKLYLQKNASEFFSGLRNCYHKNNCSFLLKPIDFIIQYVRTLFTGTLTWHGLVLIDDHRWF